MGKNNKIKARQSSLNMKLRPVKQLPISTGGAAKRDLRTQFAALCYRVLNDNVQVLMITSRGTKRWIVPKGWPMDGLTPAQAVAQEAWEEAGVRGRTYDQCLGVYSYGKTIEDNDTLNCVALVYPIKVKTLAKSYPEAKERRRKWMNPAKAAEKVDEPELAQILRGFDPRVLKPVRT